jgi:hypothetical protein
VEQDDDWERSAPVWKGKDTPDGGSQIRGLGFASEGNYFCLRISGAQEKDW